MKKWFDIAVLGILVSLAACTKVENTSAPESIRYAVGSYAVSTKASEYRAYESLDNFQSTAFIHSEGAAEGSVFFNSAITWDGATWSPDRDYYWPKHPQSYINFVSWYAHDGSADIVPNTVTETSFEISNRTVGANDRILVADEAWRQSANSTTYFTPGVPTLFRHVLSRVKVNMKATTLEDPEISGVTYEITLQSAKFKGIFQSKICIIPSSYILRFQVVHHYRMDYTVGPFFKGFRILQGADVLCDPDPDLLQHVL